jgi:hypothetical protein
MTINGLSRRYELMVHQTVDAITWSTRTTLCY